MNKHNEPCNCISYNKPFDSQSETEDVLVAPAWSDRETICVDACISELIQFIWSMGYVTESSCCGHNERPPSIVLGGNIDQDAIERLRHIIKDNDGRDFDLLQWRLVKV